MVGMLLATVNMVVGSGASKPVRKLSSSASDIAANPEWDTMIVSASSRALSSSAWSQEGALGCPSFPGMFAMAGAVTGAINKALTMSFLSWPRMEAHHGL